MDIPRRAPSMRYRVARSARRLFSDWQVLACVSAAVLVCAGVGAILVARPLSGDAAGAEATLRYTGAGELVRPEHVERWVFVGASLGLSYSEASRTDCPGMFHNVYITPAAYEAFAATKTFPEGTMLAMIMYDPGQKVAPSRHGFFEDERIALEVAVKDSARFPDRWAYFNFGAARRSASPSGSSCNACHAQHAATDNVFTQFYPVLREIP